MNKDTHRSTSSYYRTLYSKYLVEDCYLQTRRQRRATGAFLERLETKGVLADDRVPKRYAKRLNRAFQGSVMMRQITTALTVAAMLTLLQSPPVSAAVAVDRGVDEVSQVEPSLYRGQLNNDDDSDGVGIRQADGVHKSALHFVAQKAPYSPVTFPKKNSLLIDADSDMPQRYDRGSSLTVIDTSIEGWRTIKDAVIEGEVLLLKAGDPVDAILGKLQAMGEIESLSIISHGNRGALYFDGVRFSSEELEQQADKWRRVGSYLSGDGDIHLFGCHIAEDEKGKAFISQLASLTGADVAASVDPTGDSEQGGDWVLEAVQGEVGDLRAMNPERLSLFKGVLLWTGTIDFSQVRDAGAYNGAASINAMFYNNASNTYTLVGDALVSSSYSGAGYLAAPNASETQLTLSFLNSEVFNASSIDITNCAGTARTFRVTSNLGDTATTASLADLGSENVNLSGFTNGLTSLTITNDAGGVTGCFYVDNFAVVNLQPAVVNTPPALGGTFTTAGAVNDNATTSPFGSVTVTDADADNVSVAITYTGANGTLSGTGVTGSAGSYTVSSAAPATATTNLQGIVFTPTANQVAAGSTVVTAFTLTPNDGSVNGTANATTQITATSINDNPVITSNGGGASGATAINENTTSVTTVTATDVDPTTTITYSISGGADAAAFSIVPGSGALSFSSAPNFETPTDAGSNNVYDVQVTATDDGPGTLTDVQNLAVTVNNVNENPLITSDGGGASAAVNAAENQTGVTTVSAFDSDTGDNLIYSISGGADAALFGIVGGTGVLTFNAAPDFETPTDAGANGVYDVQVTVTDDGAGNLTDVQDIAVTVTSVNENPTITSNGGGANAATAIDENTTAVTTVTATDPDTGDNLTYSISGGADAALFGIVGGTGVLTFNAAPDFETPTDAGANNVYDVQVTVTDDGTGNLTDVQDIAVTVNNANDNPVITSDGGGASAAVNAPENQTAVTTVIATDADVGDNLTYSISGGADAALFGIVGGTGVLTFNAAPDFETPTDAGANGVYDVQVTVTDDGTGNLTDVQDIAVTVTGGNDNPVITSNGGGATGNVAIDENTTAVTTVTATDPDVGDNLTYSISGGADAAAFSIVPGSGVLSFSSVPNFETPTDAGSNNVYDVQVTVTDDGVGNLTDVQDLAVTVNNVNENPTITSNGGGASAAVNMPEGQTAVTTVVATDPDAGDNLTYSISGGPDAALFNIDGGGALSFLAAPSFSTPTDSGANGVYDVQVTVTDDGVGNLTDVQDIAVTVTDVNSAPGGTLTISGSATEDQVLTVVNNLTDGDGLGTMSYQWNRDGLPISGATTTTYTLGDEDVGHALSVTASYTDGGGTAESVTSNATTAVANLNDNPTGAVTISGEAAQGQTLTADASGLADGDGLGVFSYHWQSGSVQLTESSGTYTLTANDVGNQISVTVSYRDGQGTLEQVTSDPTAVVTGVASDVPEVMAPADITVNATGLFTQVDLGTATATDAEDGDLTPAVTQLVSNGSEPDAVTDTPMFFSPGVHLLNWTATDVDGNTGLDTQTVNVIPMASFSKDQISTEGETASFKVILNGPAVSYPVTVPYTLSGTMLQDGSDHSLSDGQVTINHPSLEAAVNVSFIDDGANEGSETLVVSMGTPDNAVIGPVSLHRIEVREGNVAPTAELIADQNGMITRLISQADGLVTVMAIVTDPNRGDDHTYDWSGSDNRLIDSDTDQETFTFDPTSLSSGAYRLHLAVSDGEEGAVAELLLRIQAALPDLADEDSDDDGIDDVSEGAGDDDGDGIPNYLDHAEMAQNVIQEQQGTASEFLMETEPGLVFLLGDVAFRAHGHSTSVTFDDIVNHGNEGSGAEADDSQSYRYEGGLFDFRIESLPVAGQSVAVVLPQFAPIPADAVYRKLMPSGWQDFVIDDNNRVASTAGSDGYCPPPGDAGYSDGLTEGDWCVQLTIEDGGPNDADQAVDASVDDPGGVAQRLSDSTGDDSGGGGGGSASLLSLVLLGLALLRRQGRRLSRFRIRLD